MNVKICDCPPNFDFSDVCKQDLIDTVLKKLLLLPTSHFHVIANILLKENKENL